MEFVAIVLVLILCAFFGVAFYAFYRTFSVSRKVRYLPPASFLREPADSEDYKGHKGWIEQVMAAPYERVSIRATDGVRLCARYYAGEANTPIVIFLHGYRSNSIHDGCGLHSIARKRGYHVILCDQRAHGMSGGRALSFGVLERSDARLWAEYAAKRFPGAPIFLSGISMGASTVLMAASLPLPIAVIGILADCPYSSPREIISKVCDGMNLPSKYVYPLIRIGALIYGGFDPSTVDITLSVRQKTPPILIIHGEADTFVPAEMSKRIDAAVAGKHTLVLVEGAGHGQSYSVNPELYTKSVEAFFDECMKNRPEIPIEPSSHLGVLPKWKGKL